MRMNSWKNNKTYWGVESWGCKEWSKVSHSIATPITEVEYLLSDHRLVDSIPVIMCHIHVSYQRRGRHIGDKRVRHLIHK